MIRSEREYKIIEFLNKERFVSVNYLMEKLKVSRATINRDLLAMEKNGQLVRERGGASSINHYSLISHLDEKSVSEKGKQNLREKILICREAVKYINEGDCIYIDSGSTTLPLIDLIKNMNIQVVTPSYAVARLLDGKFVGKVYLLGGEYNSKYDMTIGPIAIDNLKKFNFNVTFITANGINVTNGSLYSVNLDVSNIKSKAIEQSKNNILLVDSSKYEKKAMYEFANIENMNKVIVDNLPFKTAYKNLIKA